jgi:hypothetical protein
MLKDWWFEYWWIVASLLYVILLAILVKTLTRRGTVTRTWPKIALGINCVIILLIPLMHRPGSYINAVLVVFNVVLLFKNLLRSESSPDSKIDELQGRRSDRQ